MVQHLKAAQDWLILRNCRNSQKTKSMIEGFIKKVKKSTVFYKEETGLEWRDFHV